MLPGDEPPFLSGVGLLIVSVVDYRNTTIGKTIEFSVGIACTMGRNPAPPLPAARAAGTPFVVNPSAPKSRSRAVGIWGMPKEQGSLDYRITEESVSSQCDIDGQLGAHHDSAAEIRMAAHGGRHVELLRLPRDDLEVHDLLQQQSRLPAVS